MKDSLLGPIVPAISGFRRRAPLSIAVANSRSGSTRPNLNYSHHVGSTPDSDRLADFPVSDHCVKSSGSSATLYPHINKAASISLGLAWHSFATCQISCDADRTIEAWQRSLALPNNAGK